MKGTIIIDSNEQVNLHIIRELLNRNINMTVRKLKVGDYSFVWNNESYEHKITIERKGNLGEFVTNLTWKHNEFVKELTRIPGCHVVVMIEASIKDLRKHNYRNKDKPLKVIRIINTMRKKYKFEVKFVKKKEAAAFILQRFREFVRYGEI